MKTMNTVRMVLLMMLSGYPVTAQTLTSGLAIGTDCPAFDPYHITGADKNTRTCPMCKYGQGQGIMIWVNDTDWNTLSAFVNRMESEIESRGLRNFRVFVMYMNPEHKSLKDAMQKVSDFSHEQKVHQVALTCIPDPTDAHTARLFEINPGTAVRNTVLVYRKRKVVYKFINLETTQLNELMASCDRLFSKKL